MATRQRFRVGHIGGQQPSIPVPGERQTDCSVHGCPGDPLALAPIALCGRHVRAVYEFAQGIVADRLDEMESKATEVTDHARVRPPVVLPDRGDCPGYVYFIRLGERIKIGYSANPYARLRDLPYETILAITPGSYELETSLHRRFAHLRVVGEWFHVGLDLMEYIHGLSVEAV